MTAVVKGAQRSTPAGKRADPPPVQANTQRLKFQFSTLARDKRHAALRTIFYELHARSLSDQRGVVRRIEQIVFLYRMYPKTRYKTNPSNEDRSTWVRAVHHHSAKLAALLRKCPYGENYLGACFNLPNMAGDLDRLAEGHNANAGQQPKPRGRPPEGFDWLVANLAKFYAERTGRPADGGPCRLLVRAVCDLLGIKVRTDEAIRKTIDRLPDKISAPPP